MSGKSKHRCVYCSRGISTHRTKARICSKDCRDNLRRLLNDDKRKG